MKHFSIRRFYTVSVLSLLFSFCITSPFEVQAAGQSAVVSRFGCDTTPDTFFTQRSEHLLSSFDTYTITLGKGEQYQLPTDPDTVLSPVYSSTRKKIATVNTNGMITARKNGRATIFAHNQQFSAVYQIRVRKSSLALSNPSINLFHCRGNSPFHEKKGAKFPIPQNGA